MKILYIKKEERGPVWKRTLKELRDLYLFHHRVGFFLASLYTISNVKRVSFNRLKSYSRSKIEEYDAIVFNYECRFRTKKHPFASLKEGLQIVENKIKNIPAILLVSSPNAKSMPEDTILDYFDLIFRREHYKDLDRYDITNNNKKKIRTTVLSCPVVPSTILNYETIDPSEYGFDEVSETYERDLFFLGQATSRRRIEIVNKLEKSEVDFFGGLHTNLREPDKSFPDYIEATRLSQKQFYHYTRTSKINLGLSGYGPFTYRHWEIWALCSFMISTPSIRHLKLPFEALENEHFAVFENFDDLIDKIRFYKDNAAERDRMARNGRRLFEEEYNFHKHGTYIKKSLDQIL